MKPRRSVSFDRPVGATAALDGPNIWRASRRTSSETAPAIAGGEDTNAAGACGIFRTVMCGRTLRQLVWTAGNRAFITPRALPPAVRGSGAQVAQLVEHCTENAGVGGSIPPLGTTTNAPNNIFN